MLVHRCFPGKRLLVYLDNLSGVTKVFIVPSMNGSEDLHYSEGACTVSQRIWTMMATRSLDLFAAILLAASSLVKAIRGCGKLTGSQTNTPAPNPKPQNPMDLQRALDHCECSVFTFKAWGS